MRQKIYLKFCKRCKNVYFKNPSIGLKQWYKSDYCSILCKVTGHITSEITKQKIGNANRLKTRTEAQRIHLSKIQKGKYMGSARYNWIEDRTKLVKSEYKHLDGYYREWMLKIKNRDNWKCRIANQDCKGRLEAHHILSWKDYPELRYDVNNGITLCLAHHPRKRSEEAKLSPFFQSLVAEMN